MPPLTIMLIRHGEKPPDAGGPPFGVDPDGNQSKHSLTVRGWTRAGALVGFFATPHDGIMVPEHIYAAAPETGGSAHGSRPSETVTPLAAARGIPVETSFAVGSEVSLAAQLLTLTGPVLVAWEHHAIPTIVSSLGLSTFPQAFPNRFDLVWLLQLSGSAYALSVRHQKLLNGDDDNGYS